MAKSKRPKRSRPRFNFWLDLTKSDEVMLYNLCEELKRERKFAPTVRDGIRLVADLRRGQTDVLLELFPRIAVQLQPLPDAEALREIITQAMGSYAGAGNHVPHPAPQDLDFDMPLEISTKETSEGGDNFLDSMFSNF